MNENILELKDIVKTFGGVTALNGVSFQLKKGEVHALMGENGAGKSTFIKVITGVHQPDSGMMLLEGEKILLRSTVDSQKLGIAAIYQHVTSFPDLSVTENIFMGREIMTKFHTYNWPEMKRRAKELMSALSKEIDVNRPMSELSVAQQQLVEIAKALSRDARILIMDEPTASLTRHECEELYQIVEHLRDDGVSIIFITHKFEDMYRLATRVTVFRDAKYIGTWDVDGISNEKLIQAMVGRELGQMYPKKTAKIGDVVLKVDGISKEGYFKDISFDARKGEIVALTGLVGSSRTEVCQTLFGIMKPDSGKIYLNGKEVKINSPIKALEHGIGLLPEDRQLQGLIYDLPIYQNVTAAVLNKFVKKGILDVRSEMRKSIELCMKIQLKAKDIADPPSALSGGNQQKVVFAKLLNSDLKVLIFDEPTKGIDVGAKYSIYEIMNELATNGYTIIMVSSEMPEVLGMADRIVVMKSGRVTGRFNIKEATQEKILAAALSKRDEKTEGHKNMAKIKSEKIERMPVLSKIVNYKNNGLLVGMMILLIAAAFITPAMFKPESLVAMLRNNSIYAILSVGIMFVLLTGGIDLSIASTLSFSGVITAMLMSSNPGVPAFVWVITSVFLGSLCGLINGFLVGKLKMVPMIATLGTMYIYRGLAFVISKGVWLFPHKFTNDYIWYAQGKFLGIFNVTWIVVIIFILAGLFLAFTKPGRRIYAIGTNSQSSQIAGIKIGNIKILAYTLCGALAGLAGMLYTANYAVSYFGIADGFEMQAIAICILGGVSIVGGRGRIDGVFISVLLMSIISYFISLLPGLSVWQDAIQGAIIVIAVAINIFTGKLSVKRALKERGALI